MTNVEKLRALLEGSGLDALLLSGELNQRYVTRYKFSDGLVLLTKTHTYMLTDFRYEEEAKKYVSADISVITPSAKLGFVAEELAGSGKRIGFEDAVMTFAEYKNAKRILSDFEFVPMSAEISKVRAIKDERELETIARAQEITDAAFEHILKFMRPEMTECEIALELEFFMRRSGAEGLAFETIAVSGDASALPHGKARNLPLKRGFFTMDFGAMLDGYCSDMTRTVVIGRADEEMRRLYSTVMTAQKEALALIREGVSGQTVDRAARDIINDAGYAGCFGHGLGHGVGMYIHEAPRLSTRSDSALCEGHVVTVEPGIYLCGRYGCRIEDMVAVTRDGYRNFTKSTKELIELF